MVRHLSAPITRFFAISLAIHLLFILFWPNPQKRINPQEIISVSFLPRPQETPVKPPPPPKKAVRKPAPAPKPKQAPTRPSRAPVIVAKKATPPAEPHPAARQAHTPPAALKPEAPPAPPQETKREVSRRADPSRDKVAITERPLPTLKDLLPPLTWSSEAHGEANNAPVQLNTQNPQYITYFGSIKRAIELVWQYPDLALRYGLQGKLLLEFSILANGHLARARIIRSSGSNLLDEEALRAVQTAAPFNPIPPWIDKDRLDIIASFEYVDKRLNYRYIP